MERWGKGRGRVYFLLFGVGAYYFLLFGRGPRPRPNSKKKRHPPIQQERHEKPKQLNDQTTKTTTFTVEFLRRIGCPTGFVLRIQGLECCFLSGLGGQDFGLKGVRVRLFQMPTFMPPPRSRNAF